MRQRLFKYTLLIYNALCALTERTETADLAISARPSILRMKLRDSHWTNFREISY
jgi:hypothetical protein